jgi:hypothetical protein
MMTLFPRRADNDYRGYKAALWIFGLILLLRVVMSVNSIFNGHLVASSADGIPLDSYTPAGARAVVSLFATLGLSQLALCFVGILVLIRYRALIPFLFMLFLLEHLGRRLISYFRPGARVGRPPGIVVNLILLSLMVVGLALSLRRGGNSPLRGSDVHD